MGDMIEGNTASKIAKYLGGKTPNEPFHSLKC